MRIPFFRPQFVALLSVAFMAPWVSAQTEESSENAASAEVAEATEQVVEKAEEGGKSFEQALDEIEENRSSLLSDSEEAPYLFEYEYEYEYDSDYNSGFKPKSESGAVADSAGEQSTDRIAAAGQDLVDASLLAPKSRVREQFVKLGGESLSTIGLHSLNDLSEMGREVC